jgi:hypothetical protein
MFQSERSTWQSGLLEKEPLMSAKAYKTMEELSTALYAAEREIFGLVRVFFDDPAEDPRTRRGHGPRNLGQHRQDQAPLGERSTFPFEMSSSFKNISSGDPLLPQPERTPHAVRHSGQGVATPHGENALSHFSAALNLRLLQVAHRGLSSGFTNHR